MMLDDSKRRFFQFSTNLLFLAIALTLFILNSVKNANIYLQRDNYYIFSSSSSNRSFIIKNGSILTSSDFCPAQDYSIEQLESIYEWLLDSSAVKNQLFQAFFWFTMIVSLIFSSFPPILSIVKYFRSNKYNKFDRFWLKTSIDFCQTFFSLTIFLFPSAIMNSLDLQSTPCFQIIPEHFVVDVSPLILAAVFVMIVYFLFCLIIDQCYGTCRWCCASEWISYAGLGFLALLIFSLVIYSSVMIFYVWIISFIYQPLRLSAILILIQFPFLPFLFWIN